jgi:hypothetical protein
LKDIQILSEDEEFNPEEAFDDEIIKSKPGRTGESLRKDAGISY